ARARGGASHMASPARSSGPRAAGPAVRVSEIVGEERWGERQGIATGPVPPSGACLWVVRNPYDDPAAGGRAVGGRAAGDGTEGRPAGGTGEDRKVVEP